MYHWWTKGFDQASCTSRDSPLWYSWITTVRRLFFRQPGHYEYLDKVIKFEIIELKIYDDVLKVLVQFNYWKQFGPIEILAVFSKQVMEMEDDVQIQCKISIT